MHSMDNEAMDLKSKGRTTTQSQKPDQKTTEEIKGLLRHKLEMSGMSKLIRRMVRDICSGRSNTADNLNPEEVIEEIYRRGIINSSLKGIITRENQNQIGKATLVEDEVLAKESPGTTLDQKENVNVNSDENEGIVNFAQLFTQLEALGLNLETENSENSSTSTETTTQKGDSSFLANYDDEPTSPFSNIRGRLYLKMEILSGCAFLDHLYEDDKSSNFVVHVFYKSQRFSTKPTKCCCDPALKDIFVIDIGCSDEKVNASELLMSQEPIKIILIRNEESSSCSSVISHCIHDWRSFLMADSKSHNFSLELMGIGSESKVPIGLLNLRLSIIPSLTQKFSKATYSAQINSEETHKNEAHRLYLVYAKQWWKDFQQIRPGLVARNVKLFSYDENMFSKPVQAFIKPIVADNILLTPHHAAWFVSLMPVTDFKCSETDILSESRLYPKVTTGVSNESEYWQSLESTIASKSGSVADHAILLCSLLLGFGLDAYVAFGTKIGHVPWFWVVTFNGNGAPKFWESTKGKFLMPMVILFVECYRVLGICQTFAAVEEEKMKYNESIFVKNDAFNIKTVSVLFNNKTFFANVQPSDRADLIDWTIKNPSKWKPISESVLKCIDTTAPTLLFESRNMLLLSTDIEIHLKTLILKMRQNQHIKTNWDDRLRAIMGQKIANDEILASSGARYIDNYFESVILNYLPPGYDFKAYQHHSYTVHSSELFRQIKMDPKFQDIIFTRGDDAQISVRVSCFPYPEELTSVRLMVACKFLCVD